MIPMKLDRLLAMVMILINKKRVQAKDLADMFEISVRTVYRDIEAINQAGIPIVTYQGVNGGIAIADGYKLDKHVMTNDELASIAIALRSVSSSYDDRHADAVLQKIEGIIPDNEYDQFKSRTEQLFVDYSPWGDDPVQKGKLNLLKEAIQSSQRIVLTYYSPEGSLTRRETEPYTLVFKGQKWYLYAYCLLRQQFRFFKVLRIKEIEPLGITFERKSIELEEPPWNKEWNELSPIELVLRYDKSMAQIIEEWFGMESLQDDPDSPNHGIVKARLPENQWLHGFLLSLGPSVEVLGPPHIRDILGASAASIAAIYSK